MFLGVIYYITLYNALFLRALETNVQLGPTLYQTWRNCRERICFFSAMITEIETFFGLAASHQEDITRYTLWLFKVAMGCHHF